MLMDVFKVGFLALIAYFLFRQLQEEHKIEEHLEKIEKEEATNHCLEHIEEEFEDLSKEEIVERIYDCLKRRYGFKHHHRIIETNNSER